MLSKMEEAWMKNIFSMLVGEWDMRSAGDLVMWLGDFNGHIGRHIDGFDVVHGGHGVG